MGHHLSIGFGHFHPKGQVVAVVVGVVDKAAVVDHQAAGVGAVAPGVPTRTVHGVALAMALPGQPLNDGQGLFHVLALGGFVQVLVVDPAPAVAGDFMTQLMESGGQLRVALQGHGHAKHGDGPASALKLAQDAPHPHARAIFVNAFHAHVAVWVAGRVEHFAQKLFAAGVAVQGGVFAAFFVVENKLHRHPGLAGPLGVRRVAAVADQVAGVGPGAVVVHGGSFSSMPDISARLVPHRCWARCAQTSSCLPHVAGARPSKTRPSFRRAPPWLARWQHAHRLNAARHGRFGTSG